MTPRHHGTVVPRRGRPRRAAASRPVALGLARSVAGPMSSADTPPPARLIRGASMLASREAFNFARELVEEMLAADEAR